MGNMLALTVVVIKVKWVESYLLSVFFTLMYILNMVLCMFINRREHNSLLSEAFFIFMCAAGEGWHVCVSLDVLACVT